MCITVVLEAKTRYVRSASPSFLVAFGLEECHIVGRSLRMLYGPSTDVQGLSCLINSAEKLQPCTLAALYDAEGALKIMGVAAEMTGDGACILRLELLRLESSKAALSDDGTSKVVLCAHSRGVVHVGSTLYGFCSKDVRRKGLRIIHGPGTDVRGLGTLMDAAARTGQRQRGSFAVYGSECSETQADVAIVPAHTQGIVTHLVLHFEKEARKRASHNVSFSRVHSHNFVRVPSCSHSSLSERAGVFFIKAALLFLALPVFLRLGGPIIASAGGQAGLMRLAPPGRPFDSETGRQHKGYSLLKGLRSNHGDTGMVLEKLGTNNKITLMLDLDKTVLYGNDGNDLGVAAQWMDVPFQKVKQLYTKLINPNLRKMYDFYAQSGKEVSVVIYTRRPQIVYYRSCVSQNTVPVRYSDEFHGHGQLYFPSSVDTSEDILATYVGPELLEDEEHDVKMSLDRLLAARDAVMSELGLSTPPPVVVTAQTKNIETTANFLNLPVESCLLFDDNVELSGNPRVVLVKPLETLPPDRRADLLAFLQRELPVDTLEEDLVEYMDEADASERSIRRDANGKLSWSIPEAVALQDWRTPEPRLIDPSRSVSLHTLALKGFKGIELESDAEKDELFSDVSPADVPLRVGHGLVDLCAAVEKAAHSRELDHQVELARQLF